MTAHAEVTKALNGKGLTFSDATPGVSTLSAGNVTLSMKDLEDIIRSCKAANQELVFTAGALKIRPTNSNL